MVMARKPGFALVYAPEVKAHLKFIEAKHHGLIRRTIEQQLRFEPRTPTRNRKQLEMPIDSPERWELRFGPNNRFRVFYRVDDRNSEVRVLAIGLKLGNSLFIGPDEVKL